VSGLFASYQPESSSHDRRDMAEVEIRRAESPDAAGISRIIHERSGGEIEAIEERISREIETSRPEEHLLLVAIVDTVLAGFARASYFLPLPDHPPNVAPRGWYLTGLIVGTAHRRRGIGHALTSRRLEYLGTCAVEAFYFANSLNRASIDLHAQFGFRELTRDFFVPGASFTGGTGILHRIDLPTASH
jgi:ribosomal protein S18 acetylase RimI-like enzyme